MILNKKSSIAGVVVLTAVMISGCTSTNRGYSNNNRSGVYDVASDSSHGVRFVPRNQENASPLYAQPKYVAVPAQQATPQLAVSTRRDSLQTSSSQDYSQQSLMKAKSSSEFDLPPAKPGECYARVFIPPRYETVTEEVLVQEAGNRVEVIPADYEWVQEQVVVQEESRTLKVIPAEYEWVETRVMLTPASQKTVAQEALYDWTEEKILVKAAHTTWKKGEGLSEVLDNGTGEIMCLVEVPAEYKTVRKKVLIQPAGVKTVQIPAEYKTMRKKVMVRAPQTLEEIIPAEYETVQVQKLVNAAYEKQIKLPPQYETVTKERQVSEGQYNWKRVLCETNLTKDMLSSVQRALQYAGYSPGAIDGRLGMQTLTAIGEYQQENRLATGGLTYETLEHLGLR